jgi:tRNA (guanine37-N1)-methyltransferase
MIIETLSVFPLMFEGATSAVGSSIVGRARAAGLLRLINHDLRDYTHDRHRTTDDEPYGGGQGLLMKVEPVFEALDALVGAGGGTGDAKGAASGDTEGAHLASPAEVIFLAPFGQRFDQAMAVELSSLPRLVLVAGRYEGFDERAYSRADRVVSLGDFIMTGGELAAMCVIDAVCRLLPGALGDDASAEDESFNGSLLEYPQYTRPAEYRGLSVPEVLLSGNHALIRQWRREQSIIKTAKFRPDLLSEADLSDGELLLAQRLIDEEHGR